MLNSNHSQVINDDYLLLIRSSCNKYHFQQTTIRPVFRVPVIHAFDSSRGTSKHPFLATYLALIVYITEIDNRINHNFIIIFVIPSPMKLRRDRVMLPSVLPSHPCEHSRINILQWILTKLGTYLVLRRIWNPIDFQGQRSR